MSAGTSTMPLAARAQRVHRVSRKPRPHHSQKMQAQRAGGAPSEHLGDTDADAAHADDCDAEVANALVVLHHTHRLERHQPRVRLRIGAAVVAKEATRSA